MSKTIAIISWKGGVGKTTSAVNLSSYIQMQKRKVCVVDLDPQHSMSKHLGIFPFYPKPQLGQNKGFSECKNLMGREG